MTGRSESPGSWTPLLDRWGSLEKLSARLGEDCLVVIDARVAKLHPSARKALQARPCKLLIIPGGERAKSLSSLEKVLRAAAGLTRSGTLVAIGGGTIGDLCTVAAHLHKRGVKLIQVPTTLLAAVDSSVGGKGAVDLAVRGKAPVKNALGVFHYAAENWLCPELFTSLSEAQLREGRTEAWKMIACLDPKRWKAYHREAPTLAQVIRDARALKARVCEEDPYEQREIRPVLNFGHTFGHVLESISAFRLSHGDAVGLGMLCALDVGRALGATAPRVADEVEASLLAEVGVLPRSEIARTLQRGSDAQIASLLAADKKNVRPGEVRMVLLKALGRWELRTVRSAVWRPLLRAWRRGVRP